MTDSQCDLCNGEHQFCSKCRPADPFDTLNLDQIGIEDPKILLDGPPETM